MTKMTNKRKWLKLATFALAVSLVVSACGGGNSNEGNNNGNPGTPTATASPDNNTEQPTETPDAPEETPDNETDEPSGEASVQNIVNKFGTIVELEAFMEVDKAQIADFYNGIDADAFLEEGKFYVAMFNISASEFSVVKLKSDSDFDAIKEAFEFRAESVQQSFREYLQDQYALAQDYQIVRNGDYVMFSISDKQEELAEAFNSFFQ